MTARQWVGISLVFWVTLLFYGCAMAVMVFGLEMTEPGVLLLGWMMKAFAAALASFGCAMIGILGKLLGGVEGLVEDLEGEKNYET